MLAVPCGAQGTARAGTVTLPYQVEYQMVPLATKDAAKGPFSSRCILRATPPASKPRREAINVREPGVAGARKVATTTTNFPNRGAGNANPSVPMMVPVGM
jgi:hypothetical protein